MPAPLTLNALPAGLQALADWREALAAELAALARLLAEAGLLGHVAGAALQALTRALAGERLVVAVVGDTARGKSELINALFFADAGRRLLPVGPGGCTVCPVELAWQPRLPATLDLLPIASRRQSTRLADWRQRRAEWQHHALAEAEAGPVAEALAQVALTHPVSRRHAASLGLLPEGPQAPAAPVEVPVWRHALANLSHPLLRLGLVVLDTPGLGGLAVEPELTMGLLPQADLLLFVVSAQGAGPADEALWQQHLQARGAHALVAMNGLDEALDAPAEAADDETLAGRRADAAALLGLPPERVFSVSARQALAACWAGDEAALGASGIEALEAALRDELLVQRHRGLASEVVSGVLSLLEDAKRRLRDQRRGHAEQMLGLRGLRSESADRFTLLKSRLGEDSAALQHCAGRLDALRAVQAQAQRRLMRTLGTSHLETGAAELQATLGGGLLRAGTRAASFAALCQNLRAQVDEAALRCAELDQTWRASFERINADFGSFLAPVPAPELPHYRAELDLIEQGYSRYFSLGQAVRMATPEAAEPLRRMLVAKLKLVFEDARGALADWHQAVLEIIDEQLAERREQLNRREHTLQRIERAADELEQHLHELEAQDNLLLEQMDQALQVAARLRKRAEAGPWAQQPADQAAPTEAASA